MSYIQQHLVSDGSLILSIDESVRSLAQDWMPSLPEASATSHPLGPSIQVDRGELEAHPVNTDPSLALGDVEAWVDAKRDVAWIRSTGGEIGASADLASRVAKVTVTSDGAVQPSHLTSLLTITAALLLVRDGRTPIHSAGVVHPETGKAWLLVGDSHSGKSTTTANLIRSGWSYLSDDYVVLARGNVHGDVNVEGWPDDFHLDQGWHAGHATGIRATIREDELPSGRRLGAAVLDGLIFPRVSAAQPTLATVVDPISALERVIRQSPWLIADSRSAPRVLDLLRDAASGTNIRLRLGADTFADPDLLDSIVRTAVRETP